MPSSGVQTCALDRKSTRLNSSHGSISVAVSLDRKSTRLNSSHGSISYAVFCLKKIDAATSTRLGARIPAGVLMTGGLRRRAPAPFGLGRIPFFNDTATTEIYTLSLHDALPI